MSELDLSSMSLTREVKGTVERPTEKTEAHTVAEKGAGDKGKNTEVVSRESRAEEVARAPKAPDGKALADSSRVEDPTGQSFRVEKEESDLDGIHDSSTVEEKARAIHEPPPPIQAIAALFVGRQVPRFGCILDSSEFASGVRTWLQTRGEVEPEVAPDVVPEAAKNESVGIDFLFAT